MNQALEIAGVTKRFGSVVAVDSLSLAIGQGEIISLLGPSGCGKTTALRLIAGFEQPDSGSIRINGRDVGRYKPYERNVGLLFQHYALFPHMTVEENIAYGLRHQNWERAKVPQRVEEMLALVKLVGLNSRRPAQLSGGQQQRVALARALATSPQVILLDEPLSALDAKLRQDIQRELREILDAVGSTVIIVTHDQEEAMALSERIVVLNGGRIEQDGTHEEIYSRPRTRFVAEFIGRSNWMAGRLEAGNDGFRRVVLDDGLAIAVSAAPEMPTQPVDVCIRPECIEIASNQTTDRATGLNVLTGTLTEVVHLGANRHFFVELPSGSRIEAIRQSNAEFRFSEGQQVSLRFPAKDCIVLGRR